LFSTVAPGIAAVVAVSARYTCNRKPQRTRHEILAARGVHGKETVSETTAVALRAACSTGVSKKLKIVRSTVVAAV
jgi:hypothetical protein